MNYFVQNKPNQTQFQSHRLSKLFLFFTFLCPSYNLGKTKIAKIFLVSIFSPRNRYGNLLQIN
jgi:hypothetical protein